jgi:hypothetical protein
MNLNPVGWASAALRLLARLDSDGVNSTTPVTEINGGALSAPNADIALVAKGTGATLAQVPDGTAAGGNKRGTGATDWQKVRSDRTYVASGVNSVIGGGTENQASGQDSTVSGGRFNVASNIRAAVGGGEFNTANGIYAFIGGGGNNTANPNYSFIGGGQSNVTQTNTHATVCGGNNNTASGQYSFVGGGTTNTANGTYAFVGGGGSNIANSSYSSVLGGVANTANAERSCVVGGAYGTTRAIRGLAVFPSCASPIDTTAGVTQSALLLLGRQTTDATATVLTSNTTAAGTTNQVILPNNSAYSFSGEVIAGVTGAGNTARWTIDGAIKRGANAASTAMVGTATVTMTHNDAGAATWVVAVTADTTNGGIAVTVTGAAATTIRWVCKINTTEMTY